MRAGKTGLLLLIPAVVFGQTALSTLSDNRADYGGTVPVCGKFELTLAITGSPASNSGFPYEVSTPARVTPRIGITVDGLFLPPGESDWARAIVQPGFYYQPMREALDTHGSWIYPEGAAVWKVRFAPRQTGTWQYRVRVRDDAVTSGGTNPNAWLQSATGSISVGPPRPGNHGFVEVSPQDSRYFRMSDGTEFIGLGHQSGFDNPGNALSLVGSFRSYGVDFIRVWMSQSLVVSRGTHSWDPWRAPGGSSVHPRMRIWHDGGVSGVPWGNHDFSLRLMADADESYIYRVSCCGQDNCGALEAGRTYRIRIRAKIDNVTPAGGSGRKGLVLKIADNIGNAANFASSTVANLTGADITGTADWQVYESSWTNTLGRTVFSWGRFLALGLQNVTAGTAYIDEVYVGEELSSGGVGPNVITKGNVNYHLYFDQNVSHMWDRVFDSAAAAGVYLRPVVMEKDDDIYNAVPGDDFHSAPGKKVRRLHEYYWRYLAARWGYSTGIHSWELLNEGSPDHQPHYEQANAFADFMHRWDRNHMATTSFWCCWRPAFWNNTSCDFADIHAYISTSDAPTAQKTIMEGDAAWYRIWHSREYGVNKPVPMPVVRGEAGMDSRNSQDNTILGIQQDRSGVWLHNFLWAGLHSGRLYEQYWWTEHLWGSTFDHRHRFPKIRRFLTGLELHNGGYKDWDGVCSNANIRVVGQKNTAKSVFHLWIQNTGHTWRNVVNGTAVISQSATVTVGGFAANAAITVEWWNTEDGVVASTERLQADASGNIRLTVSNLQTDVALRALPPATARPIAGVAPRAGTPVVRLLGDGTLSLSGVHGPVKAKVFTVDGNHIASLTRRIESDAPATINLGRKAAGSFLVSVETAAGVSTVRILRVR